MWGYTARPRQYQRRRKVVASSMFPCDGCVSRCFRRDEASRNYVLDFGNGKPIEPCSERTVPYWERLVE